MSPGLRQIEAWADRLKGAEFVSIGWNCNTAHYLKIVGARRAAYPFDWVFSSPAIVADAISRRFDDFIAPDQMIPIEGEEATGHRRHHARLFNHGSPNASPAARSAYRRRIDRFLNVFDGAEPLCLIATVLPEPDKRPQWRDGFVRDFALPDGVAADDGYAPLRALAAGRPGPTFLVLIRQWTNRATRNVTVTAADPHTLVVDLAMTGSNDGVRFLDSEDDACCRDVYAALSQAVGRAGAVEQKWL